MSLKYNVGALLTKYSLCLPPRSIPHASAYMCVSWFCVCMCLGEGVGGGGVVCRSVASCLLLSYLLLTVLSCRVTSGSYAETQKMTAIRKAYQVHRFCMSILVCLRSCLFLLVMLLHNC